jgi:cell wall-associated NlpC family hydrolase
MANLSNYIGIRYKDRARDDDLLDCWGLLCLFYRQEFGILLPEYTVDTPDGAKYVAELVAGTRKEPVWAPVSTIQYGDVLLFRVQGLPIHCGVSVGEGEFLHSFPKRDSCIERLDSLAWQKRFDGAYRWVN